MNMLWRLLLLLAALLLCLSTAAAQALDIGALAPIDRTPEESAQTLDLYCGPTQGFYRHAGHTLDTGAPYVVFGQYDCWAMAAQGTAEAFGPVGWVEAGSLDALPEEPQLGFDDALPVTVGEGALLTDDPLAAEPAALCTLEAGTQVILLAQFADWAYVQTELDGLPVRAFIPAQAVL